MARHSAQPAYRSRCRDVVKIVDAGAALLAGALFLLPIQTKTPGIAAVRPFYYVAIGVLFLTTLYSLPVVLRGLRRMERHAWWLLMLLALIYVHMFVHTLPMSTRALKDFILGASVDIGCLIVLLAYHLRGQASGKDTVTPLAWMFVLLSLTASVIAWACYFGWTGIGIAGQRLWHNLAWGTRLHGWLGEPTQLGAAMTLGAIAGLYLLGSRVGSYARAAICILVLPLFGATLYGAGTRNGLVSTAVGLGVMILLWRERRLILLAGGVAVFLCGLLQMIAMIEVADIDYLREAQKSESFVGHSAAELQLFAAFRLDDQAGLLARLQKFAIVFDIYRNNGFFEQVVGSGYGFTRTMYGSAFNDYLESIVDFGALFVALLLGYFAYLQLLLLKMIRRGDERSFSGAMLGTALLMYSMIFAMNSSSLFPDLFHFSNFAHIVAASVALAWYLREQRLADTRAVVAA